MTAAEEPVTVGRAATGSRLYVKATECAVTSVSAPLAVDLLIAHFGASPADAEAVLSRVYRTHGGPTPGRCAVTALAELSVLLGVTVTDVRRERIDDGDRQPDDNA